MSSSARMPTITLNNSLVAFRGNPSVVVSAALVCQGCWCAGAQSPSSAAAGLAGAVERARVDEVRRGVVDDRGQPVSHAEIEGALVRERLEGSRALAAAAARSKCVEVTARYELADGSVLVMERCAGQYRFRIAPLAVSCPKTVLDALRSFRAALSSRPGPRSIAPLSQGWRSDDDTSNAAILDGLRYADELDTTQVGAMAHVTLPTGYVISLTIQQGCWWIDGVS